MLRPLAWRLLALFRRRGLDAVLGEEIQAHLEMLAADYERRGMSPQEARLAARRAFGAVEPMKERYRDVSGIPLLATICREVRFGLRVLARDRWFSASVVVILAVGIAANAVVFTIVNGILLRDLPVADPDRVVTIRTTSSGRPAGVSYLDFLDWRDASRLFGGLAAASDTTMNVADGEQPPERLIGSYVSANTFALLGHAPLLGRAFLPSDDRPGADPVVMLGHSVWRTRYAADPRVVGRTIRVNGVLSTVIGVMPEGFGFPTRSRAWQPLALLPGQTRDTRGARVLSVFGRLAADTSLEQALAELRAIVASLAQQHPASNAAVQPVIRPFNEQARGGGRLRLALPLLMTMVGVVLLIACANAANLQLARAADRAREISVRLAIGASRVQVVRQLLVESSVLACLAGVVALGVAVLTIRAFRTATAGIDLPYWISFPIDWTVFGFLAAVSLATALVFGVIPALHLSRAGMAGSARDGGAAIAGSSRRRRLTSALVVGQLALTPALLTGGGLMLRSIVAQQHMEPGFETSGIVRLRLELRGLKYESASERARFYRQLEERLASDRAFPAALASHGPFEGSGALRVTGLAQPDDGAAPAVGLVTIGGDYFGGLGSRILRGRSLVPGDGEQAVVPVVVNQRFVELHFGDQDPIGRTIELTEFGREPRTRQYTIVGIAPNIRQRSTERALVADDPIVYMPYVSNPLATASVFVRTELAPATVASVVRRHVNAIDSELPVYDVMTLDDSIAASDDFQGLLMFGTVFAGLAAIALMLATAGLYGVTAYAASQRTREIGIRMAIGAAPRQVGWMITSTACRQVLVGLSIGSVGALGMGQLLRGLLVGVGAVDPLTFACVALLLAAVTVVASYLPARRAATVDPVLALRAE